MVLRQEGSGERMRVVLLLLLLKQHGIALHGLLDVGGWLLGTHQDIGRGRQRSAPR